MQYLTVKVIITGVSNGANIDYGSRQRDVEMTSKYDVENLFKDAMEGVIFAEDNDK